jgi:hypothetical protein
VAKLNGSPRLNCLVSIHPKTFYVHIILRSSALGGTTKNLIVSFAAEILRGACPEPVEGLRMTSASFRTNTTYNVVSDYVVWREGWKLIVNK